MLRTGRRVGYHEETSFPSILDEFLVNSREKQAFYANLQTSCNTVINPREDSQSVREFVYDTIFFDVGKRLHTETDSRKLSLVNMLQRTILRLGKDSCHGDTEFEVSAVWVLYFDHAKQTKEAVPVFKIYTGTPRIRAVFVDVGSRVFLSWDEYIEKAQFPESLLCVPRHGEYRFKDGGDDLYLDYMCAVDPRQLYVESYSRFRSVYTAPRIPLIEKLSSLPEKILTKGMEALLGLKRCYDKYMATVIKEVLSIQKKVVEAGKCALDDVVDFWNEFVNLLFRRVRRLPVEAAKDAKECSLVGDTFWSEDVVPLHGRSVSSWQEWLVELQENMHGKYKDLRKSIGVVLGLLQKKAEEFLMAAKAFWDANHGVLITFFLNLAATWRSGNSSSLVHLQDLAVMFKDIKWKLDEIESTERELVPYSGGVGGRMAPKDVSGQNTELVNVLSEQAQEVLNSSDLQKALKLWAQHPKNWKQILLQWVVILLRYGSPVVDLLVRATSFSPQAVLICIFVRLMAGLVATGIEYCMDREASSVPSLGNASGNV